MLRLYRYTLADLREGLWFSYNGDEVLRHWPWSGKAHRWQSLLAEGGFNSLREMDEFWEVYREAESEVFLVKSLRKFLGSKGLAFFRRVYKEYGKVDAVLLLEGGMPHPIHFREGLLIRNHLRELTAYGWGDHAYDDRWAGLVERAIQNG